MELPPEQAARQAGCFHQSETSVAFAKEDVENSIPARYEKIVRMFPNNTAIKTGARLVTYSELNEMANRLAHSLLSLSGMKAEPIAIMIDKGIEQIASMLGILKAGKFLVPVDPSYPSDRAAAVIKNSGTNFLLVDSQTAGRAAEFATPGRQLLHFDAMQSSAHTQDLNLTIPPETLACLVYTTGSTGQAKGVIRDHRGLLHGALLRVQTDGISSSDRLAHITSGTANAVTNSFYVLLQGAVLITLNVSLEGIHRLAQLLVDEKISICLIASPVFRKLCEVLSGDRNFPDLRYLRLRSATVYPSDVELFRNYFPDTCLLANGLASSETGPTCEYRISNDTKVDGAEVPVGFPLIDKEILLLDDTGKEVGFNRIGEIVVRSKYLSLGYWKNPELTSEKFKQDPDDPNLRRFYTGDLGMMLPGGCVIHKGRKDFRIKVRGYGVDLVEIEKALRRHPRVRDAVVVDGKDKSGETRLVAYLTTTYQEGPTTSQLRRFLGGALAGYMIPSAFVKMESLPLTPNGKIDRKALPEPSTTRPALDTTYVEARNDIERRLVSAWEEILDVYPIGIDDGFFDLGGHSLTASRIVSKVYKDFQIEVPLKSLFESPTIAQMASVITRYQGEALDALRLATILDELESLSDEEVARLAGEYPHTGAKH